MKIYTPERAVQKIICWFIVFYVFLEEVSAADTFRFTQCQCPGFKFPSDEKKNFPNRFKITELPDQFRCPGENAFPAESGLIFGTDARRGKLTNTGVDIDLFKNSFDRRIGWHAAFRLSFSPVNGAGFKILQILENDVAVLDVIVEPRFDGNSFRGTEIHSNFGTNVTAALDKTDIDIVVGEFFNGEIPNTDQPLLGNFICASSSGSGLDCDFGSDVIEDLSNVKINILEQISFTLMPAKVSMVSFGNGFTGGVDNIDTATKLTSAVAEIMSSLPPVVSLPSNSQVVDFLTTDEDVASTANVSTILNGGTLSPDDLKFSINNNVEHGILNSISFPEVIYTPNKDFNGQDSFDFTYGIVSPFVCSNTLTATIDVTPVPDAPVASNVEVEVFLKFPQILTIEVGSDVDGELNGTVVIGPGVPGLISESCSTQDPIQELSVVNGSVTFCYDSLNFLPKDAIARLSFTITDDDNLSSDGVITFKGVNPFLPPEEIPIEVGSEDSVITFSLGGDRYGRKAPGLFRDFVLGIRFIRSPLSFLGDLTTPSGVPAIFQPDFTELDSLQFTPSPNVFNALQNEPNGPSGVPVSECNRRVTLNGKPGYCAIFFQYKLFFEKLESDILEAFFIVNAVDDGNPQISVDGQTNVNVQLNGLLANEGSNGVVTDLEGHEVVVSSDAGGDVFRIKMQMIGGDGVFFGFLQVDNRKGFVNKNGFFGQTPVKDCSKRECTSVEMEGTPAQLEEVMQNIRCFVPVNTSFPALIFRVAAIDEDFKLGFDLEINFDMRFRKPRITDDIRNVHILIVLGVTALVTPMVAYYVGTKVSQRKGEIESGINDYIEEPLGVEDLIKRLKWRRKLREKDWILNY